MVRRCAVDRHPSAGGVIGDHPAQGGARTRRDIRPEAKPVGLEEIVQEQYKTRQYIQ